MGLGSPRDVDGRELRSGDSLSPGEGVCAGVVGYVDCDASLRLGTGWVMVVVWKERINDGDGRIRVIRWISQGNLIR